MEISLPWNARVTQALQNPAFTLEQLQLLPAAHRALQQAAYSDLMHLNREHINCNHMAIVGRTLALTFKREARTAASSHMHPHWNTAACKLRTAAAQPHYSTQQHKICIRNKTDVQEQPWQLQEKQRSRHTIRQARSLLLPTYQAESLHCNCLAKSCLCLQMLKCTSMKCYWS